MTEETLEDRMVRAVRRDSTLTTVEKLAVVMDPWWRTVPRGWRVAWWLRWNQQEWAHSAGYDSWGAFLAAQEQTRLAALEVGAHDQPPAEWSTRDGWPEGFAVPAPIVRLAAAVDPSWDVRTGYARGYRKVGRGNVGTGADARWELTHFVILHARPAGVTGSAWVRVAYAAPVGPEKLAWKHDASSVGPEWRSTVTKARAALTADAAEMVATLSADRQSVASVTDMFAL